MGYFRSDTQPLCRFCGKPIAKVTNTVYLPDARQKDTGLHTRADAQKVCNLKVVKVAYTHESNGDLYDPQPTGRRWVASYNTWDGETYQDQFFCRIGHAADFGYACAANNGLGMPDYHAAVKAHKEAAHA